MSPWRWRSDRGVPSALSNAEPVPASLAIYDDLFPYQVSGFRLVEYETILQEVPTASVFSTLASLGWLGIAEQRSDILGSWKQRSPALWPRLQTVGEVAELPNASAFYTIFLNNAFDLLPVAESRGVKFSFTLYPGGGLAFGDETSETKLRRVLASANLHKVIVTQPLVLRYLTERFQVPSKKVEYVFGGVLAPGPSQGADPRPFRAGQIPSLGFVANRYHPSGHDKGLDVFVDAVRRLNHDRLRPICHFVGPWSAQDAPGLRAADLVFHGSVPNDRLQSVLRDIDICVFPTRPEILSVGSFDGYPTGSAIEAGLAGCAVITSNPLGQSTPLLPGRDLVEVPPDAEAVARGVRGLLAAGPRELDRMRRQGQATMRHVYSLATQMTPRVRILNEMLSPDPEVSVQPPPPDRP